MYFSMVLSPDGVEINTVEQFCSGFCILLEKCIYVKKRVDKIMTGR